MEPDDPRYGMRQFEPSHALTQHSTLLVESDWNDGHSRASPQSECRQRNSYNARRAQHAAPLTPSGLQIVCLSHGTRRLV